MILEILELIRRAPEEYQALRRRARERVQAHFTWASFMNWVFGKAADPMPPPRKTQHPSNGSRSRRAIQLALYEPSAARSPAGNKPFLP
jgi:hypothetical protein